VRALVLNCTPELVRVADYDVRPGVSSDEGQGDQWPQLRAKVLEAEILVMASPTWLGQPSSVAKRVLERMDAMLSETDDQDRPVAYNRVAAARALKANPMPAPAGS
jgi:multimeric flavodoxin WrbA